MIYFREPAELASREVNIDDSRMIKIFGFSYQRSETLSQILDLFLTSNIAHTFRNARDLQRYIINDYINNIYLNMNFAPIFPGTPVTIIMQGNRTADFKAADEALQEKLQLSYLPQHDGYTWHHRENLIQKSGRWECVMYLVESGYHRSHPHRGGVYEYTLRTGKSYT